MIKGLKGMNGLFQEFIHVCGMLNNEFGIIPVLYGSLGLQQLLGKKLNPDDIDLLVPEDYLEEKWNILKCKIEMDGYELIDLEEHEFLKKEKRVMFAKYKILIEDLCVDTENLKIIESNGIKYKTLTINDYLKAYEFSYKDGYRRNKNNGKDKEKIKMIKDEIKLSKIRIIKKINER